MMPLDEGKAMGMPAGAGAGAGAGTGVGAGGGVARPSARAVEAQARAALPPSPGPRNATRAQRLGLVFGLLTYLMVAGFLERRPMRILVGVAVFLFYGSVLLGVLPGAQGISWQGHLFGAIGGGLAAWWLGRVDRTRGHSAGWP